MLSLVLAVSTQLMTLAPMDPFNPLLLDCSNRARLSISIAPGHYLAKDSIEVRQEGSTLRLLLPGAEVAEFAGKLEDVYRRRVYLEAGPVKAGQIEIAYQGCNEETLTCLPPQVVTLSCAAA